MSYEEYFGDWVKLIDKNELNKVLNTLNREYNTKSICPTYFNIFKAFNLCPLNKLKVVCLAQDPYPQKGVATGIAFGNSINTSEANLSPSLNIIKEAVINYEVPHNTIIFDNSLEDWCKQGVLMLNSALTCEVNKAGSHTMLWRGFIAKLLFNLSKYDTSIVYVLFGKQAQTFTPYINKNTNYVIKIEHPAYFARTHTKMSYTLFREINELVKKSTGTSIIWYKEVN